MWAVVEIKSKQYRVEEGQILKVERIKNSSSKINLDKVLLYVKNNTLELGRPYLKDVRIEAEVLGEEKGKKVITFKYKRRKGYHRKKGHRQVYTRLRILNIKKQ